MFGKNKINAISQIRPNAPWENAQNSQSNGQLGTVESGNYVSPLCHIPEGTKTVSARVPPPKIPSYTALITRGNGTSGTMAHDSQMAPCTPPANSPAT